MKHITTICLSIITLIAFYSCEKLGDNVSELSGKSFTYTNGEIGSMRIYQVYEFQKSGNVYYYSVIGNSSPFDTKGCDMYYTLDGNNITIYKGIKGWKKEDRHSVFASGLYYGDYIEIEGKKFYE